MRVITRQDKRRLKHEAQKEEHVWFAWHPVRTKTIFIEGTTTPFVPAQWLWLERVYRKRVRSSYVDHYWYLEYRPLDGEPA